MTDIKHCLPSKVDFLTEEFMSSQSVLSIFPVTTVSDVSNQTKTVVKEKVLTLHWRRAVRRSFLLDSEEILVIGSLVQ